MNKEQVLGIVRHVLTAVGSILVLKGYSDEVTITSIIGGLMASIGGIWSIIDKKEDSIIAKANEILSKRK